MRLSSTRCGFFLLPLCASFLAFGAGCNPGHDTFMLTELLAEYQPADHILTVYGDMQPTLGPRCANERDASAPAGSGAPALLVDTATPLSAFVPATTQPALPFRHGELALYAANQTDRSQGPLRLLLCEVPMVRTDQMLSQFVLTSGTASTGPLGGVLGGDLLGRFALTLNFTDTDANLTFTRSDIAPACQLDDAVLPFRPLGGQLAVEVGDAVITYPATRITIAACVEPVADPLRPGLDNMTCLDHDAIARSMGILMQQQAEVMAKTPVDQATLQRIERWIAALTQVTSASCGTIPDAIATDLGDVIEDQQLLLPAFVASGVDMQFLVSTAVPDLLISQTACQRLGDPTRCTCADADKKKLRLPGLNPTDMDAELGCKITLGSSARTALALVARQRYLSGCSELARSRRQRYALPSVIPVATNEAPCLRNACLVNLQRDSSQTALRCAYSGPDPEYACDDHASPVGAVVEIGGPKYAPMAGTDLGPDLLEALVVPDTARILQSANADIRSDGPQVDGVIGLAVLSRLASTIDYPQTRVAVSCRCGDTVGHVCRAYRTVTYNPADSCSQASTLEIPADYGRTFCR